MGLFGIEGDFLEDGSSVNEVGFRSGFTQTMDRDYLIFLLVVRAHSHEIVTLAVLKLYVSYVGFKSEPDSKPLRVLLRVEFIKVP